LACHGPFANLVNKDIKVPADPNPVNPHVFVPHDQKEKFYDCIACHTPHAMPAPKGFKDKTAHIEPCYSCHHGEQIQKCSQCHKE
jgi:predicted CXXCH cytochrome family protein